MEFPLFGCVTSVAIRLHLYREIKAKCRRQLQNIDCTVIETVQIHLNFFK